MPREKALTEISRKEYWALEMAIALGKFPKSWGTITKGTHHGGTIYTSNKMGVCMKESAGLYFANSTIVKYLENL